jgi:hypothetical protein
LNAPGAPAARGSRLGAAGLVALLIAAVVLGLYVYRARTPDLALEVTAMPREFKDQTVEIEFFVRFDEPAAKVEIVGRNQVLVKTLDAALPLESEARVTCVWDGTADGGGEAPPGRYRLRVTLPSEDRVMVFPRRVDVQPGAIEEGGDAAQPGPCVVEDPK